MLQQNIQQLVDARNLDALKGKLAESGEIELIQAFHGLDAKPQAVAFRLLAKERALEVFEALDVDDQQHLLLSLADSEAAEYFAVMAPDDRVAMMDEMPAAVAERLMATLTPEERAATNTLMGYAHQTAGRIMTPEFISLRRNMTAAQALERVRQLADEKETIYTLYVTDNTRRLEGVISLRDVLTAAPDAVIGDVMSTSPVSVTTDDDQEVVARMLQDLDLLALPVVDKEGRIVGIVTVDDAIDVLEDEVSEDIFDSVGLIDIAAKEENRSDALINGSLWRIWKVRLPFLFITVAAGMLAGLVIEGFEDALAEVIAVAVFIPLIMDMGGNVGTQSSTVFARGVVLGHIQLDRFWRYFAKEAFVGLTLGLIVGTIGGAVAGLWQGMPALGLAVGVALLAAMTLASILGFLVPFLLIKLGIDQAAGSAPIITSIKDIAGLLIYFGSVVAFMELVY